MTCVVLWNNGRTRLSRPAQFFPPSSRGLVRTAIRQADARTDGGVAPDSGRLALLAGEFQRVALSATVQPFDAATRFVGSSRLYRGHNGKPEWIPRPVAVVAPRSDKLYGFTVAWPPVPFVIRPPGAGPDDRDTDKPSSRYETITEDLVQRLARERSTMSLACWLASTQTRA